MFTFVRQNDDDIIIPSRNLAGLLPELLTSAPTQIR